MSKFTAIPGQSLKSTPIKGSTLMININLYTYAYCAQHVLVSGNHKNILGIYNQICKGIVEYIYSIQLYIC